jgi:hypothetical protein
MLGSLAWGMVLLMANACDSDAPAGSGTDRGALLRHWAEAVIQPGYAGYAASTAALTSSWDDFVLAPNETGLLAVQDALQASWTTWQTVAPFDFGPAMNSGLAIGTNRYPTDTIRLQALMDDGSWNLDQADNADAQGFPALDWMLNARSTDATLAALAASASREALIGDLVARLAGQAAAVNTAWENYGSTFIAADGVDVGSSAGLLINASNRYLERDLRDGKLGIPLGYRSLGAVLPGAAEARFSGKGKALLQASLDAYAAVLGQDGARGIKRWLDDVDARYGDMPLSDALQEALDAALLAVDALPSSTAAMVLSDPEAGAAAYEAIQRFLILYKVDMPSALGILITYQDNDGD